MYKRITLFLILYNASFFCLHAQVEHPVKWAYGEKKIGINTYEIHLRATMEDGWHVYAQKQPANSISVPTSFKFKSEYNFILIGKPKELGKLITFNDPNSGLGAYEYSGTVDFVQMVRVTNPSVTSITGRLTYQACTDHKCLSSENVEFSIPVK